MFLSKLNDDDDDHDEIVIGWTIYSRLLI